MPKIYSAREILKALQKAGFVIVSQKGSHVKLKALRIGRIQTVIVPNHKSVARGTFASILRQAAMSENEFENYV